jgi:hypothetical protein
MQKRLYFLHIPKVGGMNISSSVVLNKNISIYNTSNIYTVEDFYSAQYVYGHMGITPIKKDPNLSVACILRDPLKRFISNFIHSNNVSNSNLNQNKEYAKIKNIEDKLRYYLFEDSFYSTVNNFQSRSIFNEMKEDAFDNMFKKNSEKEYEQIEKKDNLWYLSNKTFCFEDIKNIVDSFDIIGTTENHDKFFENFSQWFLYNCNERILKNNNFPSKIKNNQGYEYTTESLFNMLNKNEKDKFESMHSIDFELYRYVTDKNV